MIKHTTILDAKGGNAYVRSLIRSGNITMAGNAKLKIVGLLSCKSGKRMKPVNRVFFKDIKEAVDAGFRPCGHCMINAYKEWVVLKAKS